MWLDQKYINLLSGQLEKFKRKSQYVYNFRCPICGDSQLSSSKARGNIYNKKGTNRYHCFNCGVDTSFDRFLKQVNPTLHAEYILEKLSDSISPERKELIEFEAKMEKPIFLKAGPLKGLKKVSQLSPNHPVKKFVDARRIPNPYHATLFACPNFKQYTNSLIPNKFSVDFIKGDETRLLIPFISTDKKVHAYQGRTLGKSTIKYITIVLDESIPKVYGLDKANFNRPVNVFEGPIDSMFVPNSISTGGGDLVSAIRSFPKNKLVIVYDNEPRSPDTIKKIDKAIMNGYSVCIWPENMEHKDINDMILAGLSSEFIEHIIKTNTYKDLSAKVKLSQWSKV
jgi:predicted RNA-binding Zn-ribbon protein involved in translation (DUF1610 family)